MISSQELSEIISENRDLLTQVAIIGLEEAMDAGTHRYVNFEKDILPRFDLYNMLSNIYELGFIGHVEREYMDINQMITGSIPKLRYSEYFEKNDIEGLIKAKTDLINGQYMTPLMRESAELVFSVVDAMINHRRLKKLFIRMDNLMYLGSEDFKDVTPAYRYGIAMYSKYLRGETPVAEEKDIDVIVDQELSSLTNFNSLIDISDSCDSLTDKLKSFGIYNTKQLKNYHKGKSYRNNILYSNSPYSIREYFGNIVSSHYNDHNLYNNHNLNNMIKLVDIISGNDFNMSKHHILLDLLVERVR